MRIEREAGEETDKSTSKGTQHWNHGLRERVGKEKGKKNGQLMMNKNVKRVKPNTLRFLLVVAQVGGSKQRTDSGERIVKCRQNLPSIE